MQVTKYFFFTICLFLTTGGLTQTAPTIQWQKCLGGIYGESATSVQQTADGGYIVAGFAAFNGGDVTGNHGGWDFWIVKLTNSGTIQWQKSLGGSNYDVPNSIQQTTDGGYIVAGYSMSSDGDVSGNHGSQDFWVVKIDATGNIQWQKCLGGTNNETASYIQQTVDGGYIVSGYSNSNDGDVSSNHGSEDFWVVKLNATGNIQWQKCLGGTNDERARSIRQSADGGYIVGGWSTSNDGDVSGHHGSVYVGDAWVVKLDASGNIQWQKCLGGSNDDYVESIQQTTDGGYIVAGGTWSNDGDVSGNHGTEDLWVVKLGASGNIQWQKCLGGTHDEIARSIQQTTDGSYIVAGHTWSNNGDVSGKHGGYDFWVIKLNTLGTIQWQKCLGGTDNEFDANSIQQTADGGYIVAGNTNSNDGNVSGNHGSGDYWIVKLGAGVVVPLRLISFTGVLQNNATKLNWQTTDERNTKDFIVERSADAINFSSIGKVNAQTSSATTHSYHYTDKAALPGTNFYRLKMEDKDDRFTYSNVIRINHNNRYEIMIAPNPVANSTSVSFTIPESQNVFLKIFDVNGNLIKILADKKFEKGKYTFHWFTVEMSAGIYFLHFDAGVYSDTKKLFIIK